MDDKDWPLKETDTNKPSVNELNKKLNGYLDDYVDAERTKYSSMLSVARILMEKFYLSKAQAITLAKDMCEAAFKSSYKEEDQNG